MPQALELEEYGLEVEHEHHALMAGSPSYRPTHNMSHLALPKGTQRVITQDMMQPKPKLIRPGMLKWAVLVLALALVVFIHLRQENDETIYIEEELMPGEEVEVCEDDPNFKLSHDYKGEQTCASWVSRVGREGLLNSRCNQPIGIPDENKFQKLLKHFCPRSCGLCGTEEADPEEGVSEAVIEAEVKEVAQEIEEEHVEEKRIEDEIKDEIKKGNEDEKRIEDEIKKEIKKEDAEEKGDDRSEDIKDNQSEKESAQTKEAAMEEQINNASAKNEKEEEGNGPAQKEEDDIGSEGKESKQESDVVSNEDTEEQGNSNKEDPKVDENSEGQSVDDQAAESSDGAKHESHINNKDDAKNEEESSTGGTFNIERIEATRKAAQNLITELEEYYFGVDQSKRMMLDSWIDPWLFDKTEGAAQERTEKLVDTIARALVTDDQKEFLIGTIGSSVAAGHDNCHYDSYENQLERTFGPIWEAAGMKLTTQNAGEGGGCGDDYKNQAFCIKQNVSPNIDILHYSWTYFEEGDQGERYAVRESLVRWTQMLPRQPPVHVFNALWMANAGEQEVELAKHYGVYGYNSFYMREGHKLGGYDYDADTKKGIDHYAWGFVGDGYHNVARYGKEEKDPDRKESLGVVMRNWHPGPLAFEFVSDTFAYVYTKAMLLALDMIESSFKAGTDPRDIWSASKRKIVLKNHLPEPKYCDPTYCVVNEAPGCLNFEKPTFGYWGARVEDALDDLNPYKGEVQKWTVWHEENDIWYMVGKQDQAIFQNRDEEEQKICTHIDQCGGISATSPNDGMVVFRLPKMEVGLVAICGCCGKNVAEEMFLQNKDIEISYNGQVLDRQNWDVFPTGKCVRLLDKFPTGAASMTPTGHAYLAIKALEGLWKPVRISHVITL